MKYSFLFFYLLAAMLNLPATAAELSGSDLAYVFARGRQNANELVRSLEPTDLPLSTAESVRSWFSQNQQWLADDVAASNHVWTMATSPTCAETQRAPKSDINLHIAACRASTRHRIDAGELLIHESVHHFGLEDERFCDAVVFAVYQAWREQGGNEATWEVIATDGAPLNVETTNWHWQQGRLYGDDGLSIGYYEPLTKSWHRVASPLLQQLPIPSIAAVSPTSMLFWNSVADEQNGDANRLVGAVYFPSLEGWDPAVDRRNQESSDRWVPVRFQNSPISRSQSSTFWTGDRYLIWGGFDARYVTHGDVLLDGATIDPETGSWLPISPLNVSHPSRTTAVWTGSQLLTLILSGTKCPDDYNPCDNPATNTLATYDPRIGNWTLLPSDPMLVVDSPLKGVWSNGRLYVITNKCKWGQEQHCRVYDLSRNEWGSFSIPGVTNQQQQFIGNALAVEDHMIFLWRNPIPGLATGVWYETSSRKSTPFFSPGTENEEAYVDSVWAQDSLFVSSWHRTGQNESGYKLQVFYPELQIE